MSNVKLGFIGCGGWAQKKYLPYLKTRNRSIVTAFSMIQLDADREKLSQLFPNAIFFDTTEEMLEKQNIDALIISLPHNLHFSALQSAINHLIPTLIDKPLCSTYKEASQIVDAAKQQNLTIAVSNQRRSQGGMKFLNECINNNELGEIFWIDGKFIISSYVNWHLSWRNDPNLSGSPAMKQGLFLDTGYHILDAILYLLRFEEPSNVFASSNQRGFNVDHDTSVIINFLSGRRATISTSRGLPDDCVIEEVSILGEKAFGNSVVKRFKHEQISEAFIHSNQGRFRTEAFSSDFALEPVNAFLKHVELGKPLENLWKAENSLLTIKVIDAIYHSIKTGLPVEIKK